MALTESVIDLFDFVSKINLRLGGINGIFMM